MSAVVFVIYIPTPEEEEKLRKAEQKLKNEQKVETKNEKNSTKPIVHLQNPNNSVNKSFDNNGFEKPDENRQKYLTYRPLQPASPNDLIDLSKESKDHNEKPHTLKEIVTFLLDEFKIQTVTWTETENRLLQVIFAASGDKSEDILDELVAAGVGKAYQSNVSVLPCTLHYEPDDDFDLDDLESDEEKNPAYFFSDEENKLDKPAAKTTEFIKSIKARLTVAQVVDGVRVQAAFTFDFVVLIVLASLIAAMGLVENSPVALVASMLVSPLMGPILAGTFGSVINDSSLKKQGLFHELIGLGLCILCGFIFGIICGPFNLSWGTGPWPTVEMTARGHWRCLWVGALIALPSGAGVALSVLGGNMGCLVGVAISASLLPPAVNAGVLWGLSVVLLTQSYSDPIYLQPPANYTTIYYDNMVMESAVLGIISLILTLLNIACIILMGILVLRIKEVAPGNTNTKRFWKHDIRVTRNYNKTLKSQEGKQLSEKFLEEWSALNNGSTDEKKLERKLSTIIQKYQNDPTLRNVARYSCYRPPEKELVDNPYITWHNPKNAPNLTVPGGSLRQRHFSQVDKPRRSRGMSLFHDPIGSRKVSRVSGRDIALTDIKEGVENSGPKRKDSRFTITKSDTNPET